MPLKTVRANLCFKHLFAKKLLRKFFITKDLARKMYQSNKGIKTTTSGQSIHRIRAISVMFKVIAQSSHSPIGENSPNLVTLEVT
jgi:xanthine dehydrogenase iron-sulfur cluster and FAD-binding subunit A